MGTATYKKSTRTVWLQRRDDPVPPRSATMNSGRVAWFSISDAFASESASTLPEVSITVARTSPALAASSTSRWMGVA